MALPTLPTLPSLSLSKIRMQFIEAPGPGITDPGIGGGGDGGIGGGGNFPPFGGPITYSPISTGSGGGGGGGGATLVSTPTSGISNPLSWLLSGVGNQLLRLLFFILGLMAIAAAVYLYKPSAGNIVAVPIKAAKLAAKHIGEATAETAA